jgi:hypothetical protein
MIAVAEGTEPHRDSAHIEARRNRVAISQASAAVLRVPFGLLRCATARFKLSPCGIFRET